MSTGNNDRLPSDDDDGNNRNKKPSGGGGKGSGKRAPGSPSSSASVTPNIGQHEVPSSPHGTVATCDSSTGDDDISNLDVAIHGGQHHRQQQAGDVAMAPGRSPASAAFTSTTSERRQQLQREMFQLAVVTTASFAALIVTVVPMSVLALCGASGGLFVAMLYKVYQRILLEYQATVVNGQGLAPYLPDSIRRQLTDMSLHEYMSDDTLQREYGYLLLYFVPGIGSLDPYINRLTPRHQQLLHRRGLGHILGPTFMRWLVGGAGAVTGNGNVPRRIDTIQQARLIECENVNESMVTSVASSPPRSTSASVDGVARIEEDDADEFVERDYWIDAGNGTPSPFPSDLDERSPSETYARFMGLAIPGDADDASVYDDRKPAAKPTAKDDDDEEDDDDGSVSSEQDEMEDGEDKVSELDVVYDACVNCVTVYSAAALDLTRGTVSNMTGSSMYSLTRNMWRASSALAVVSLSVGVWGWYAGVYDRPSSSSLAMLPRVQITLPSIRLPSSSAIWSTTVASGLSSVGLTLFMMVWPNSSSSAPDNDASRSSGKQKDDKK